MTLYVRILVLYADTIIPATDLDPKILVFILLLYTYTDAFTAFPINAEMSDEEFTVQTCVQYEIVTDELYIYPTIKPILCVPVPSSLIN